MSRLSYDHIKVRISHKLNNYRVKHPLEETTYGTYTILSSTSRNIFPSYSCVPSACIIFITTLNQDLRGCVKVREHYNTIPETINSKQEITRCSRSDYLNVICNSLQITNIFAHFIILQNSSNFYFHWYDTSLLGLKHCFSSKCFDIANSIVFLDKMKW